MTGVGEAASSAARKVVWNEAGRVKARSDNLGTTFTSRLYDAQGRVTREVPGDTDADASTIPDGARAIFYFYELTDLPRRSLPTEIREPSLLQAGECSETSAGACHRTILGYDAFGHVTQRDEYGWTQTAGGQVVPYHDLTRFGFDAAGRPTTVSATVDGDLTADPPLKLRYDYWPDLGNGDAGRLSIVTRLPGAGAAELATRYYSYDDFGRAGQVYDENAVMMTITHDGLGRVLTERRDDVAVRTTVHAYGSGQLLWTRLPEGNYRHRHFEPDDAGFLRLRAVTRAPAGVNPTVLPVGTEQTRFEYDAAGNVVTALSYLNSTADPEDGPGGLARVQRRRYAQGRLDAVLRADGNYNDIPDYQEGRPEGVVAQFPDYDANGNVLTRLDHTGSAFGPAKTTYTYARGRLQTITRTGSEGTFTSELGYDARGNVIRLSDGGGVTTSYSYDDRGALGLVASADSGRTAYEYHPGGLLKSRTDGAQRRVAYEWDQLGRVTRETPTLWPDIQQASVGYRYDEPWRGGSAGRLTTVTMSDLSSRTEFYYDAAGRLQKEVRTLGQAAPETVAYAYNHNDTLTDVGYPQNITLSFAMGAPDPDRATTASLLRPGPNGATTLARDIRWHAGGGSVLIALQGNNVQRVLGRTLDGYPTEVARGVPGASGWSIENTAWDFQGNILKQRTFGSGGVEQNVEYEYDQWSRLVGAHGRPMSVSGNSVVYRYAGDNRRGREFYDSGQASLLKETYYYYKGTNRLQWLEDPITAPRDCPPEQLGTPGDGGDQGNNGCRDHGEGLGCHDAGPEQRHKDAGAHGGGNSEKDQGDGGGEDANPPGQPDGGTSSAPPPCADGTQPAADRRGMQQDWVQLVSGARTQLADPRAHWDRSYNNVVGKLNSFLAKYQVQKRILWRALLAQGTIHDLWAQLIDRRTANGPRWSGTPPQQYIQRRQTLDQLLVTAQNVDIRAIVAQVEGTAGDDRCFEYDEAGNLVAEGYTGKLDSGCNDTNFSDNALLCYSYDGFGRLTTVGYPRPGSAGRCVDVLAYAEYQYDFRGRRVRSTVYGPLWDTVTTYLYDRHGRLIGERAQSGGDDIPGKHYYWLGGQPLAQEQFAELTSVLAAPGCGTCAVGTRPTASHWLALACLLGCLAAVVGAGRALRRRDRLGVLRLLLAAGALGVAAAGAGSCVAVPLATPRLYYYTNDHLGTPQLMTDVSGHVVWAAYSEPFGATRADQDVDGDGHAAVNNLRFPGQYDEQVKGYTVGDFGLHYNDHRWYDPTIGRYTQPDPLLVRAPRAGHHYGYAAQNPLRFQDPSGLEWYADPGAYNALKTVLNGPVGPQAVQLGLERDVIVRRGTKAEMRERAKEQRTGGLTGGFTRPLPDGTIEIVYNECIWAENTRAGGRSESLSVLLAHEMGHPWGNIHGPEWNGGMDFDWSNMLTWSYHYAGLFENMQRVAESSPSFLEEGTHARRGETQCVQAQYSHCE
ncbi:MAG TPA: RHS repeat-associated core domain-containing protein [Polyangia bacterium]